ncbi:MAG: flavin reductase family protein [Pseudomonadales bacterium]
MTDKLIELRNAFGQFPTGVTVITANPDGYAPFGMTVNSFSSLSLSPPLLLWSLQNDSECWGAFEKSTQYTVNVLADNQESLSRLYAKKGDHTLKEDHYHVGASGCVVLNDVIASFECSIQERVDGGDHTILIGRVLEVDSQKEAQPLVFFSGQYRRITE